METCRTCCKCDFGSDENDAAKWLDLFHPVNCQSEMQDIRLELDIWKLQIKPNDGLPQKICTDCFTQFCTINAMRRKCQESQQILKNLFASMETASELDCNSLSKDSERSACPTPTLQFQFDNDSMNSSDHSYMRKRFKKTVRKPLLNLCNSSNNKSTWEKLTQKSRTESEFTKSISVPFLNEDENCSLENPEKSDDKIEQTNDLITLETAAKNDTTNHVFEPPLKDFIYLTAASNNTSDKDFNKIAIVRLSPQQAPIESSDDITTTGFECEFCYKSKQIPAEQFPSPEELLDHVSQYHDSVNPYNCPHCDETFLDAPSRTVHIRLQHVDRHYECEKCGKKYAGRANMVHHMQKFHSEVNFKCDLCDKTFATQKSLKYHSQWHIPEKQMKCRHCDRIFVSKRQLEQHEATHSDMRALEVCTFCGKTFLQVKGLRWHIFKNHGGQLPFKCTLCTEAFDSYQKKRLHMLENHSKHLTSEEKSQCMTCDKKFSNVDELQNHMNTDHDDTLIPIVNEKRILQTKKEKKFSGIFKCDHCPQRFNLKSALARHSTVHNVEGRPHACTQCTKRYIRVQDLKWHMKTHSDEKPNVCDICGKRFALKYVLTQHRKSHEAVEKCFQCATCGRAYLFEKSLRLHERTHTGKTFYKCDVCGEKFITHIKFLCHMRKVHTTENDPDDPEDLDDNTSDVISK